ncbi:MAG: yvdD [Pedosphaera sp.]|nr:yvdD [Pedosphaera sp.]
MSDQLRKIKRVCVYCGSSFGSRPEYVEAAQQMGRVLARRGLELVYGGGRVGLMGTIADAVLAENGRVIGVIPHALASKEIAHQGLQDLRVVGSMHERKALMVELADAFIAMPGGFGTMEEFCEVLTWAQLGLHRKPHGLLNTAGFYDSLLGFFDHTVAERFVRAEHRSLVVSEEDPERLLDLLGKVQTPKLDKWIDLSET